MSKTKNCPKCGAEIKAGARKCIFCGSWLDEASDDKVKVPETSTSSILKEAKTKPKNNSAILGTILCAVTVIVILIVIAATRSCNGGDSSEESITISNMLEKFADAESMSDKSAILSKLSNEKIELKELSQDVWETWGSDFKACNLSTQDKGIYEEWCAQLKDSKYSQMLDNDSITVYKLEYHSYILYIVRKSTAEGTYAIDIIKDYNHMFEYELEGRQRYKELADFAKSHSYDEFMIGKSGDGRMAFILKDKSGKRSHLYSVTITDTIPKAFFPPNGEKWEIVDYFWGGRNSKFIFRNPDADRSRQFEYWNYDCAYDEWQSIIDVPCLSIVRDDSESVPKLKFTWKTSTGETVSLSDYMYETDIKMPKPKLPDVSLSFTLFEKLKDMKMNEVLQYLKQHGCKVKDGGDGYYTEVSGGFISIYPPKISSPRIGVGPVEFSTEDTNVRDAWYKGLRKAGYSNEYPDNSGWWGKNEYGCPIYGVYDTIGAEEEDDYAGVCTLFVKQYWED